MSVDLARAIYPTRIKRRLLARCIGGDGQEYVFEWLAPLKMRGWHVE